MKRQPFRSWLCAKLATPASSARCWQRRVREQQLRTPSDARLLDWLALKETWTWCGSCWLCRVNTRWTCMLEMVLDLRLAFGELVRVDTPK